jgi:small-conductance mechanosensitive channel
MDNIRRSIHLLSVVVFCGTGLVSLSKTADVSTVAGATGEELRREADGASQAPSGAGSSNAPSPTVRAGPGKYNVLGWFTRNQTPEQVARINEQKRLRQAELAGRELELEKRSGQLQEKERHLLAHRKQRPLFRFRDVVNAIDRDNRDAKKDLETLYSSLDDVRSELVKAKAQLSGKSPRSDSDAESKAELTELIANLNEEIVLLRLKADHLESLIELRTEAARIDKALESIAVNPRPTVHLLVEKARGMADEERKSAQSRLAMEQARQLRDEITPSLQLLRSKQDELVQHIQLLESKYELSRDRAMRTDAAIGKIRRPLIEKRIETLHAQLAALEDSLVVFGHMRELYDAEQAVLRMDFDELLRRYAQRVLLPLAAIVFLLILYFVIVRVGLPRLYHRDRLFIARRVGKYLVVMAILLVLISFFFEDLRPFATALGIAGAAVVIALQDLFASFAGWFVIVLSNKMRVGDRIEVDGKRGDVLDIQLLRTTLLELNTWLEVDEPTGRVIVIPNSFVFKEKMMNFTHVHPYLWNKIDITVTYETPAREAEALLRRILEEETRTEFQAAREGGWMMERVYGVPDTDYEPKVFSVIAESGVLFRLLYVSHYRRVSSMRSRINTRIIAEFESDKRMGLAYPTHREIRTGDGWGDRRQGG